jgi:transcriptional regulator with XRE-family HTH domain
MISLEQMRAARGLMNWSQADLAQLAGISTTAMNNIDRGLSRPRLSTLEDIRKVFESNGVEFIEGNGVRFRKDVFRIETFEGPEGFLRYLRDIMETQVAKKVEGLHHSYNEPSMLKKHRRVLFDFYREFSKNKLRERVLVPEGVTERFGPPQTSEYRWAPKALFNHQVGHSVYGDKYCIFLKNRIVVIENSDIAEAYRQQFEANWKSAHKIAPSESIYEKELRRFTELTGKIEAK